MSAGIYNALLGRLGNKMFQFCYARALAEREGVELVTPQWEGEKIFEIEATRERWEGDREVGGYCQNQESLIYTRKQVRQWFTLRGWVRDTLNKAFPPDDDTVIAHRRVGDLQGYGYVVISRASYFHARQKHGLLDYRMEFVTEENPRVHPDFMGDLACVPDFVRLMDAPISLRGNSTFSWFAATLGHGQVFSPVIDGLEGGREHDVEFVPGNHPKFCNLDFVSDLHLAEE